MPIQELTVNPTVSKCIPFPTIRAPTPLVFAILHERVSIVKYFIHDKKASLLVSVGGFLPIHYASAVGNFEILEDILSTEEGEKQINIQHQYLYTPLHLAVANSHLKCVLLLLKKGAFTNFSHYQQIPPSQNTPLHLCAKLQDTRIAEALLSKGASLQFTNSNNETPLDTCKAFNNQKMLNYFTKVSENPSLVRPFSELCDEYLDDERKKMKDQLEEMRKKLEESGIKL